MSHMYILCFDIGLLETEGSSQDVKPVQQARTLYKTCLNTGEYSGVIMKHFN